ncbi:MAG: ABC transporter substrate-binding protein [Prevotella sp.]|nr:ABC transporter substrate-binding protein [Prevotella sp.]
MRKLFLFLTIICLLIGCGQSYEDTKRISRAQRIRLAKEDSAALKIAVLPTLDCLPFYLAEDHNMFDTVVDIRLKFFSAQMDVDTAIINRRVEIGVTDLVRAERMIKQDSTIEYLTATNAYWQLITNRIARMTQLKHLEDKMLAMTRYSVTDMLGDIAVDSAKLKPEFVFRIQINDVNIRLKMLENNEMDALLLTEPQAGQARLLKHKVILDTRNLDMKMGAVVMRNGVMNDKNRKRQLEVLIKGYNEACDSINHYGVAEYSDLVMKYCKVKRSTVESLKNIKFEKITKPRQQDIERAQKWLLKK